MKKNIFLLVSLFIVSLFLSSFEVSNVNKVNDETDKIAVRRVGGTTRSESSDAVLVEAFNDRYSLTISVENYTGSVYVELIGSRGIWGQYSFDVYEVGAEVFSTASLRAGTYTVRITLETGVYEGTFYKESVGRR